MLIKIKASVPLRGLGFLTKGYKRLKQKIL